MKQSYRLLREINPKIKVGDKIKIFDGSGLTSFKDKKVYIIFSYFDLTGLYEPLKDIEGTVLEVNVDDFVCTSHFETAYLQDVVIELGNAKFRTMSNFIQKV